MQALTNSIFAQRQMTPLSSLFIVREGLPFVKSSVRILFVTVVEVAHMFSESYCNNVALLSQAWRRYDTDRSGYIESNELKVKHNVSNSAIKLINVESFKVLLLW